MPYDKLPSVSSVSRSIDSPFEALILRRSGQLTVAAVLGIIAPYLLRFGTEGVTHLGDHAIGLLSGAPEFDQHVHSMMCCSLGVVLTHIFFHYLSHYPGENNFSSAIPATLLGFAIVLLVIVLGQFAFSRFLVIAGFIGTLSWYSLVNFRRDRKTRTYLALAPVGTARELSKIKGVHWLKLPHPEDVTRVKNSDGVVIDLAADLSKEWSDFLIKCAGEGVPVFDSTKTREWLTGRVNLVHAGDIGLDALLPKRGYIVFKSIIDFALAIITLPVILPIIALAAAAIKFDSPGPVFFVQKRMGLRGKVFNCYKLRTMRERAEDLGPSFTILGDPRITRVGRVLRKFRVDELPQVFNILKGDISWIGPRPEAVALAVEYQQHIPFYAFRHAVKPGISGRAAIRQGNVAEIEAAREKLEQDLFYIKHLSPALDVFIAAKTIWIVLTGYGSR
jgi:lipopolysaccharide/colanic/teichoic acid biosynthesis glycosyltransferase